ncbi:MAG: hypothetical protein ACFCUO_05345 [Rhodospirillales bacterium]
MGGLVRRGFGVGRGAGRGVRIGTWGAALIAAAIGGEAGATVLTFDQGRSATGAEVIPAGAGGTVAPDYGDRVTGPAMAVTGGTFTYGNRGEGFTPNVVVDYAPASRARLWTTDYGDLVNVMFVLANSGGEMAIRLTADPGFEVLLYGFDLGGWPRTDYTIDGVSVIADGTTLDARSDVPVEGDASGPGQTTIAFATPLRGIDLLIAIDFANLPVGLQDNIGIDNVRFGQHPRPIPLPAALPLSASALALLGVAAWRSARPRRRT